jgi:cytochrome c oxidase subunit 2
MPAELYRLARALSTPEEQRPAHQKHPLAKMIAIGVIASVIGVFICLQIDWFPTAGSTQADKIDTLYDVLLIVSVPIFVLVMTIAIYSVIAFRAKPGDRGDGAHIHGNTKLEVVWVTIPFMIVSALAIYGWVVLDDIEAAKPNELVVNVTGQQFAWTFDYPEEHVTSNELVLPVDRPVHFQIHAKDVLHSFWVPAFRMKQDAVPGIETETRVTPTREGAYPVVCAELCGIGHATMRQQARVVPTSEFDAWVKDQTEGTAAAKEGQSPMAAGRAIFTSADAGCNGCHTLDDANATAQVGPDLNDLAARAGTRVKGEGADEYVHESIVDPPAFVVKGYPGDTMPRDFADKLTPEEIDTLVKYLLGVAKTEKGK